ncbi:MAG: tRNA(Ile)-lysidine synthase [Flavobacteriales bacterium]
MINDAILQNIRHDMSQYKQLCIGYSGGLDSSVLLHCLVGLGLADKITAVHVNHGLSANADDWQRACEVFCQKLGVTFVAEKVELQGVKSGVEAKARAARYQVFGKYLQDNTALLTAHHLDDQCETLLFRLMRGAGLKGLTAISVRRRFLSGASGSFSLSGSSASGCSMVERPLLDVSRQSLELYAQHYGLSWVEDESNTDTRYDRNFLRQTVLPKLEERWPKYRSLLNRAISHLREAETLLEEYGVLDLQRCDFRKERTGRSVCLLAMADLSVLRQRHLIRSMLHEAGVGVSSAERVNQVLTIFGMEEDAQPLVEFSPCCFRRFRKRLYLVANLSLKSEALRELSTITLDWDGRNTIDLPGGFTLSRNLCLKAGLNSEHGLNQGSELKSEPKSELKSAKPQKPLALRVKFKRSGIRCRPQERAHSQFLKKLMPDYGLEPWLRPYVPLIYSGDSLLAVGDLFVCEHELAAELGELMWVAS